MSSKMNEKMEAQPGMKIDVALQKYKAGSTKDFDALLSSIADPNTDDHLLVSYLQQFKECITVLNKEFEVVVGVILKVAWLERSEAACVEYQSFIINLVSAHPMYLRASLRMVIKHFMPMVDEKTDTGDVKLRQKHEKQFYFLHRLLLRISQIVPMTPIVLVPLMAEYFPFMIKSTYLHEIYVKNLLQVSTYLPTERTKIMSIIVERMAKLDARAPRASIEKMEEDDESDDEDTLDVQFDMEGDDANVVNTQIEKVETADISNNGIITEPMKHQDADRLDVIMDVMIRFIHTICYPGGALDWTSSKKLYLELLSVFDRIILPTHALCHTQFLLFYICSFKEELTMGFIDFLWKKVSTPLTQVLFRQTAISYIASFLARAKYISLRLVTSTLDVVVEWVHKYVTEASHTTSRADVSHHGTFYAVCQALFYIIVFRHKQLLTTTKGHKYVQQLNLQTVVTSRLNPLKFCLPIVVKTFASVMRSHQLVFCDTIMERNRRSVLSVEGHSELHTINPLDSFFPFDPYVLSRSGCFIKPMYQEYEGTPATADDERVEHEEELEMEAESFGTVSDMPPMSPTSALLATSPSTNTDFFMYGTSPGFMGT